MPASPRSYTTARNMGIFAEAMDNDRDLAVVLACTQAAKLRQVVTLLLPGAERRMPSKSAALISLMDSDKSPTILHSWLSRPDSADLVRVAEKGMGDVMTSVLHFASARLDAPLQPAGRCDNLQYQRRSVTVGGGNAGAPLINEQRAQAAGLLPEERRKEEAHAAYQLRQENAARDEFARLPDHNRLAADFEADKTKFLSPERAAAFYFLPAASDASQQLAEITRCESRHDFQDAKAMASKHSKVENFEHRLLTCFHGVKGVQGGRAWTKAADTGTVFVFGGVGENDDDATMAPAVIVTSKAAGKKNSAAVNTAYTILVEGMHMNPAGIFMGPGVMPCFMLAKNNPALAAQIADSCGSDRLVDLQCMCAAVRPIVASPDTVLRIDVPVTWQQALRAPAMIKADGGKAGNGAAAQRPPAPAGYDLVKALLQRAGNCRGDYTDNDIYDIMLVSDGSNPAELNATKLRGGGAKTKPTKELQDNNVIKLFTPITPGPLQFGAAAAKSKTPGWKFWKWGKNRADQSSYNLFAMSGEFNAKLGYRCGSDCGPPVDVDTSAYSTKGTKKKRGAGAVASRKLMVVTCKDLNNILKDAAFAPPADQPVAAAPGQNPPLIKPAQLINPDPKASLQQSLVVHEEEPLSSGEVEARRLKEVTAYATWLAGGSASSQPLAALQPIQHVQFSVLERDKGAAAWAADIKKMLDLGFELLTGTSRPRQKAARGAPLWLLRDVQASRAIAAEAITSLVGDDVAKLDIRDSKERLYFEDLLADADLNRGQRGGKAGGRNEAPIILLFTARGEVAPISALSLIPYEALDKTQFSNKRLRQQMKASKASNKALEKSAADEVKRATGTAAAKAASDLQEKTAKEVKAPLISEQPGVLVESVANNVQNAAAKGDGHQPLLINEQPAQILGTPMPFLRAPDGCSISVVRKFVTPSEMYRVPTLWWWKKSNVKGKPFVSLKLHTECPGMPAHTFWERLPVSPKAGAAVVGTRAGRILQVDAELLRPYLWLRRRVLYRATADLQVEQPREVPLQVQPPPNIGLHPNGPQQQPDNPGQQQQAQRDSVSSSHSQQQAHDMLMMPPAVHNVPPIQQQHEVQNGLEHHPQLDPFNQKQPKSRSLSEQQPPRQDIAALKRPLSQQLHGEQQQPLPDNAHQVQHQPLVNPVQLNAAPQQVIGQQQQQQLQLQQQPQPPPQQQLPQLNNAQLPNGPQAQNFVLGNQQQPINAPLQQNPNLQLNAGQRPQSVSDLSNKFEMMSGRGSAVNDVGGTKVRNNNDPAGGSFSSSSSSSSFNSGIGGGKKIDQPSDRSSAGSLVNQNIGTVVNNPRKQ